MGTDKPPFTARKGLDDLLKRGVSENPEPEPYTPGPSDRCGLWSQHAQQGLVFQPEGRDAFGVFYGWFCSPPELVPTQGIRFRFSADGNVVEEVIIFGTDTEESRKQLAQIHLQLTLGHRQLLHCSGKIITQISREIVETENKAEGDESERLSH